MIIFSIPSRFALSQKKFSFGLFVLVLLFAGNSTMIQAQQLGIGMESYVTGGQHGTFYSAYLSATKNKSGITLGPCLQKRSMAVKGAKLSYTYLIGEKETFVTPDSTIINTVSAVKFKLRIFSFLQYVHKLPLSYLAARVETITNRDEEQNWNEVKLSTLSGGAGIELDIQFRRFTLRNYFGGSMYYHVNYIVSMYHERMSPALTFGTAISIPNF
jgi:hypothetical protein